MPYNRGTMWPCMLSTTTAHFYGLHLSSSHLGTLLQGKQQSLSVCMYVWPHGVQCIGNNFSHRCMARFMWIGDNYPGAGDQYQSTNLKPHQGNEGQTGEKISSTENIQKPVIDVSQPWQTEVLPFQLIGWLKRKIYRWPTTFLVSICRGGYYSHAWLVDYI